MLWTATTPLYLPLVYPDSLLAGCHRLARDVAARFGACPPLRPQPAPLGEAAILIGPDPAYTGGVAPAAPGTFAIVANALELIVTGADPLGTNLGLGWLAVQVLGLTIDGRYPDGARDEAIEVILDYRLPPWPPGPRGWAVNVPLDEAAAWDWCEATLRAGGDTVAATAGGLAKVAGLAGLGTAAMARHAAAAASDWWPEPCPDPSSRID